MMDLDAKHNRRKAVVISKSKRRFAVELTEDGTHGAVGQLAAHIVAPSDAKSVLRPATSGAIARLPPATNELRIADGVTTAAAESATSSTLMHTAAYQFHPLAEIFPMLIEERLRELSQDIKEHGLLEPIVLHEDKILDGRCRYLAGETAGVELKFENYVGDDPLGYVLSRNLQRRHLSESQRAMVAARVANLKIGANQHTAGTPIGAAAKLLNVSARSVTRAKEILSIGVPELAKAVEGGEVSVAAAAEISHRPTLEQREFVGIEDNRESATKQSRVKRRLAPRREATAGAKEDKTAIAAEIEGLRGQLAMAGRDQERLQAELGAVRTELAARQANSSEQTSTEIQLRR
jgi:ParB-like chromosome segregation protein Spo0J